MEKVGMIGLGNMGKGVCHCLIEAGMDVTVFDVSQQAREQFLGCAVLAEDADAVFRSCDTVVMSLPNSKVIESLFQQFFQIGVRKKTVIDLSTSNPVSTRKLSAKMMEQGGYLIDAPLAGSPDDAWAGTMNIVVAGDAEAVKAHDAIFRSFTNSYSYVGVSGNAHLIKLAKNWASMIQAINYAQIFPVMEKLGIPAKQLYCLFDNPTLANWVYHFYGQKYAQRQYPLDFALALGYKDISYMKELCSFAGSPGYLLDGALALCRDALADSEAHGIIPDMSYICEAVHHKIE